MYASDTETEARIPHDPLVNEPPRHCPDCDEPWPCAERLQQRSTKRQIEAVLRHHLFRPVELLETDRPGVRWRSPLGWSIWMTYGHQGIPLTVRDPSGKPYASTTYGTDDWLLRLGIL